MNGRPVVAATVLVALALTGCGGSATKATPSTPVTETSAPSPSPTAATQAAADQAAEHARREFEETLKDIDDALGETLGIHPGTYEVTVDTPDYEDPLDALDDEFLAPGTYTAKGPVDGSGGCYWARMSDALGDSGSILANDMTEGRALVTLNEGEFFTTSGCKPWTAQAN
jgi:hypothetical protein